MSATRNRNCTQSITILLLVFLTIQISAQIEEKNEVCEGSALPGCTDTLNQICDESKNQLGPNSCQEDLDCSLGRKCFIGKYKCEGTSKIKFIKCNRKLQLLENQYCIGNQLSVCSDHMTRTCDESNNYLGHGICESDEDCQLGRTCDLGNHCQGKSSLQPVKCSNEGGEIVTSFSEPNTELIKEQDGIIVESSESPSVQTTQKQNYEKSESSQETKSQEQNQIGQQIYQQLPIVSKQNIKTTKSQYIQKQERRKRIQQFSKTFTYPYVQVQEELTYNSIFPRRNHTAIYFQGDLNQTQKNLNQKQYQYYYPAQYDDPYIVNTNQYYGAQGEYIPNSENILITPSVKQTTKGKENEQDAYKIVLSAMQNVPNMMNVKTLPNLNMAVPQLLDITNRISEQGKQATVGNTTTINSLLENLSEKIFSSKYGKQGVNERILRILKIYQEHKLNIENNGSEKEKQKMDKIITCLENDGENNCKMEYENQKQKENQASEKLSKEEQEDYDEEEPSVIIMIFQKIGNSFRKLLRKIPVLRNLLEKNSEDKHFTKSKEQNLQESNYDAWTNLTAYLAQKIPELLTPQEIQSKSAQIVSNLKEYLNNFEINFPDKNKQMQNLIILVKQKLPFYEQMTLEQLKQEFSKLGEGIVNYINTNFQKGTFTSQRQFLQDLQQKFKFLEEEIIKALPQYSALRQDLIQLCENFAQNAKIFSQAGDSSSDQIQSAKQQIIQSVHKNIAGLQLDEIQAQMIRQSAKNIQQILQSNFGKSLSQENLSFIVHKAVSAMYKDLDKLSNKNKNSKFILDERDIDNLRENIIEELKKSRFINQGQLNDLGDQIDIIKDITEQTGATFETYDNARNAANLLIHYENAFYQALGSQSFQNKIKNYAQKYYDVYSSHVKELEPLFEHSETYKVLTDGLQNPVLLGGSLQAQEQYHLLYEFILSQMKNEKWLTKEDKHFFGFVNKLLGESVIGQDEQKLMSQLGIIERTLQDKQVAKFNFGLKSNRSDERDFLILSFQQVSEFVKEMKRNTEELDKTLKEAKRNTLIGNVSINLGELMIDQEQYKNASNNGLINQESQQIQEKQNQKEDDQKKKSEEEKEKEIENQIISMDKQRGYSQQLNRYTTYILMKKYTSPQQSLDIIVKCLESKEINEQVQRGLIYQIGGIGEKLPLAFDQDREKDGKIRECIDRIQGKQKEVRNLKNNTQQNQMEKAEEVIEKVQMSVNKAVWGTERLKENLLEMENLINQFYQTTDDL